MSRWEPGGVLHDPQKVVASMVRLATEGTVIAGNGSPVSVSAESICLHGDTAEAVTMAAALHTGLEAAGIEIASFV